MLGLLLELGLEVFQKSVVEIFTAQMCVTSGRLNGENSSTDVEEGDIESSSTEIENEDVLLGLLLSVETVCNSGCCGFVDDTENVETSDSAGVFCCESLRVVEVSRYTDAGLEQRS